MVGLFGLITVLNIVRADILLNHQSNSIKMYDLISTVVRYR